MSRVAGRLALVLMSAVVLAHGAVIVQYTAPVGNEFAPTTIGVNATADNLNNSGSEATLQAGFAFLGAVYLEGGSGVSYPLADSLAAYAAGVYFQFSVTPDAGFLLSLSSLTFDVAKGGISSPRGWAVRSSVDGYSSEIATQEVATVQPTAAFFGVDLSGAAFQGLTTPTTFRIYTYTPAWGSGMFYDNITLNGASSAVPEPSTLLMLLLGLGACGWIRYPRRS